VTDIGFSTPFAVLVPPAVLRLDPGTGGRSVVSGRGRGLGPKLFAAWDLAVDAALVSDVTRLMCVERTTGNRSVLSGFDRGAVVGRGPELGVARGVVIQRHLYDVPITCSPPFLVLPPRIEPGGAPTP
jgi:hypothetical protein